MAGLPACAGGASTGATLRFRSKVGSPRARAGRPKAPSRPASGPSAPRVRGRGRGFFLPRAPRGGGEAVSIGEVLDELVRAGHGRGHREVACRLTRRQMERFYRLAQIREAKRLKAWLGAWVSG